MPRLTFWYEFASTYSYLAAVRIEDAAVAAGVEVAWRPFLLGPIFAAQGWTTSPFNLYPAKGRYMWRDMERLAAEQGLAPIVRPDPFPQNSLLAARVATIGVEEGFVAPFTRAVYAAEFARGYDIASAETIGMILASLNLDAMAILDRARTDLAVKDALKATTAEAQALGLFGAPSFTTEDGELFWGADRLDQAIAWAAARG